MTECTAMFPTRVLLSWPETSVPIGEIQDMSGMARNEAGFVKTQVMEFGLPAMPMPSLEVDILTEEVDTI